MFDVYVINSRDMGNLLLRDITHLMGKVIKVEKVGNIFDQGGCTKGELVKIYLKNDANPHCVSTAKRIAFPILPVVKAEFERLEGDDIQNVTQTTDWYVPIVPVSKRDSHVHLCVEPSHGQTETLHATQPRRYSTKLEKSCRLF